jgi:hypothetical protein
LKQKDTEKMQNKPASGDMTKLNKEETEESTMKYIEEKLTAADPASKWISDFVKSDNPKFAGKSKKERIQQALGAYYAKKRGTNEEVEQMDEGKDVDHAKLIANSLAATHPNFRVSSYNGDHGRAHVVHHKSDTRNFKNGEQLMGPNIQLQHNHETNKVHMEMQGDYDNVPDRDEETHHPDKAHEAAHKMFKPAIDLIHTTDKKTTNEEVVLEEPKDAADVGEYDYEGDMAKSQLRSILANAKRMHDMLEDTTNLPEWVQSKITLAEDYVVTAANYMESEMNEAVRGYIQKGGDNAYLGVQVRRPANQAERDKLAQDIAANRKYNAGKNIGRKSGNVRANAAGMTQSQKNAVTLFSTASNKELGPKRYSYESVEGKVAVTPKEKSLAAHHGDKTKITYGDVIKARLKSAAAKKMGK